MSRCVAPDLRLIRWLTVLLFMIFAMTTDSVGTIIPQVVKQFGLSLKAAGAFHYVTMTAIALSGVCLGSLADVIGRKRTILLGLTLFAVSCFLFVLGDHLAWFLCLLALSGAAIGLFKTAALALIGDISSSTTAHTATMNLAEGFFACGAIIGPALVAWLIGHHVSWKWLYTLTGSMCLLLILITALVQYPQTQHPPRGPSAPARLNLRSMGRTVSDPYALAFAMGAFLYVAVEAAVYVWGPTYLALYRGPAALLVVYAIPVFFIFRALGRFLGVWLLVRFDWPAVLLTFSLAIWLCMAGSAFGGLGVAVWLLPLSGLFMSVVYPTLNSKGISCFPRAEHGRVAGVLLFFTCAGAVLGPLAMGAIMDTYSEPRYAFVGATLCAALLFAGLSYNWLARPTRARLEELGEREYATAGGEGT